MCGVLLATNKTFLTSMYLQKSYNNARYFLSAGCIYVVYGTLVAVRYLFAALLNTIIVARLCDDNSQTCIIERVQPDEISLCIRQRRICLWLRKITFNASCPLTYKVVQLSSNVLVVQVCQLKNIVINLHCGGFALSVDSLDVQYYIINEPQLESGWGKLDFLHKTLQRREQQHQERQMEASEFCVLSGAEQETILSSFANNTNAVAAALGQEDPFMRHCVAESKATARRSSNTSHKNESGYYGKGGGDNHRGTLRGISELLLRVMRSSSVSLMHTIVRQQDIGIQNATNLKLNFDSHKARCFFDEKNRLVLQLANLVVALSQTIIAKDDNDVQVWQQQNGCKNVAHLHFTKTLSLLADFLQNSAQIAFADDDDDAKQGQVRLNLASSFVSSMKNWTRQFEKDNNNRPADRQQATPPNNNVNSLPKGVTKPTETHQNTFKLDVRITIQIIINTVNRNSVRCCVKDAHLCYDTATDERKFCLRAEHIGISVERRCTSKKDTGGSNNQNDRERQFEALLFSVGAPECNVLVHGARAFSVHFLFGQEGRLEHRRATFPSEDGNDAQSGRNASTTEESLCCSDRLRQCGKNIPGNKKLHLAIDSKTEIFWHTLDAKRITILFADNQALASSAHLRGSFDASSLNCCLSFVSCVARDLLDTLLPNRLYVPGLAEARREYHTRTDEPAAAVLPKNQTQEEASKPNQPLLFLVLSLAKSGCKLQLTLRDDRSRSNCTLQTHVERFDWSIFSLPASTSQFCANMLTASWAVDFSDVVILDGVVGSHWNETLRVSTPLRVRIVQKTRYLPALQSEKKIKIYSASSSNNGGDRSRSSGKSDNIVVHENQDNIEIVANVHEATLRFLIHYYKQVAITEYATCSRSRSSTSTSTPSPKRSTARTGNKKVSPSRTCYYYRSESDMHNNSNNFSGKTAEILWSLGIAQISFRVSYKPQTNRSGIQHSTFLDLQNVPNLPLSNARIKLGAYAGPAAAGGDNVAAAFTSLPEALQDYFRKCCPQIESLLLSASGALPIVQPIVQTATDLAHDLRNPGRSWSQTAARVASNVVYGTTKISVATYKAAKSTDRWLAKRQKRLSESQKTNLATTGFGIGGSDVRAHSCPNDFCPSPLTVSAATTPKQSPTSTPDSSSLVVSAVNTVTLPQAWPTLMEDYCEKESKETFADNDDDDDKVLQHTNEQENDGEDKPVNTVRQSAPIPIASQRKSARQSKDSVSIYANQPTSFHRGVGQSVDILRESAEELFSATILEPRRVYRKTGGSWKRGATAALYGLPRVLTQSATGLSSATVKIGHGISNSIDKEKCDERQKKWKCSSSYSK